MLLFCDQGAARNTTFTKITCALLLNFNLPFLFMIIKTLLNPIVSVAEVTGNSNSCGYTRGNYHTVNTCLIADVYHAKFTTVVSRLADVTFSHDFCQVSDDVIVLRHLVKQDIDTLVGLDL